MCQVEQFIGKQTEGRGLIRAVANRARFSTRKRRLPMQPTLVRMPPSASTRLWLPANQSAGIR